MKIQIIVGSTRPNRFGGTAGQWVSKVAKENPIDGVEFELVDLQDINLPLLDEPVSASQNQYANQHTKDWSAKVSEADGYVFVTAEYNHSYNPALKNAIDYLYQEWNHKPVAFVSYGAAQGGTRAIEHLRGVAGQLKMYDLPEFVSISNYWNQLDQGNFIATELQDKEAADLLASVAFWAQQMKQSRVALQKSK